MYLHRLHFLSDRVHDESKSGLKKLFIKDFTETCKTYSCIERTYWLWLGSESTKAGLGQLESPLHSGHCDLWPVSLGQPPETRDIGWHWWPPPPPGSAQGRLCPVSVLGLRTCWPPFRPMPIFLILSRVHIAERMLLALFKRLYIFSGCAVQCKGHKFYSWLGKCCGLMNNGLGKEVIIQCMYIILWKLPSTLKSFFSRGNSKV